MSYRLRLTLFFVLIVALPMVAVAILVSEIASDSEDGKTDARITAGLRTATNIYEEGRRDARASAQAIARSVARDPAASTILREGDEAAATALAQRLRAAQDAASVALVDASGRRFEAGSERPIASAEVALASEDGSSLGSVEAATFSSASFIAEIGETTGEEAALVGPRGPITGTTSIEVGSLPAAGEAADLDAGGRDLRVATTRPLDEAGLRIAIFAPTGEEGFLSSRPRVAIVLLAFIALALLAIGLIARSLRGQVREMLGAAQRIGGGDFSGRVPVSGRDEMAGLAGEFNRMSDRLAEQMALLRRQRSEIERSVHRIGEAFVSGLDRQAMLEILVETATGACDAEYGLVALSGHVSSEANFGSASDSVKSVALAAEERALHDAGLVELARDDAHAIASSLGTVGSPPSAVGVMTVARSGRPFEQEERDVFLYLIGQAAASVENVALHELVSQQAVTDELTGLPNKRAFRSAIEREVARSIRFSQPLSLIILDVDDFKQVNDTLGHLQGDEVLRQVGRAVGEESREIDAPARFGGEEFVVALPQTDSEGAFEVAERIRERVAATEVFMVEGGGTMSVTASLGVATMPLMAGSAEELLSAADAALYRAKRAGKNRTVLAEPPETADATRAGGQSAPLEAKGRAD